MSIFSIIQKVITSVDDSFQDIKRNLVIYFKEPDIKSNSYVGISDKILLSHKIDPGQIASYERELDVAAAVIGESGATVESRVFGERVFVHTFEIASRPTVRFSEVMKRNYNMVNEVIKKGCEEIEAVIDANVIACVDHAASMENNVLQFGKYLQKTDLLNLKKEVEKHPRIKADKFVINPLQWNDMLDWRALTIFDEKTQNTGLYGRLWNCMDVYVSDTVPNGKVYCLADKKTVGRMPVVGKIRKYKTNEAASFKYGWVLVKNTGFAVLNIKAVAMGTLHMDKEPDELNPISKQEVIEKTTDPIDKESNFATQLTRD